MLKTTMLSFSILLACSQNFCATYIHEGEEYFDAQESFYQQDQIDTEITEIIDETETLEIPITPKRIYRRSLLNPLYRFARNHRTLLLIVGLSLIITPTMAKILQSPYSKDYGPFDNLAFEKALIQKAKSKQAKSTYINLIKKLTAFAEKHILDESSLCSNTNTQEGVIQSSLKINKSLQSIAMYYYTAILKAINDDLPLEDSLEDYNTIAIKIINKFKFIASQFENTSCLAIALNNLSSPFEGLEITTDVFLSWLNMPIESMHKLIISSISDTVWNCLMKHTRNCEFNIIKDLLKLKAMLTAKI